MLEPVTRRARALRQQAAQASRNALDRFFDSEAMVDAERTPFTVIHEQDPMRVRYYPPLQESVITVDGRDVPVRPERHDIPLVLVSPLAVNMYIYDLFQQRSLVRFLRSQGFELYLVDWGRPDWRHNHFDMAAYFAELLPMALGAVRTHSGQQKLSLHGWSFGGLFSYATAALGDTDIENLVLVGAPCDYHANGALGKQYQRLSKQMRWAEKRMGFRVHATRKRLWRSPGWANALAFKLTNPVASVQGYVDLLRNLHDEEYVRAHATNGAFLDDMVAYPGAVVQDIIQYLWTDNVLANGQLPMRQEDGDTLASFAPIQASTLMICGEQDPIVTRRCSTALLPYLASSDVTVMDVRGGHMGILGGSSAPRESWFAVADWLAQRSSLAREPQRRRA